MDEDQNKNEFVKAGEEQQLSLVKEFSLFIVEIRNGGLSLSCLPSE